MRIAFALLALMAFTSVAHAQRAPQPIPGAAFFETDTFALQSGVPVQVVPARATRRTLIITVNPNVATGTRIEIGGPDLACAFDGTGWIASISGPDRFEVATAAEVWACAGNGTSFLSYIELFD